MKLIEAARAKQRGTVNKDRHYFDAYDFHFGGRRHEVTRLLEIGVSKGGSLWMWKEFFPGAHIHGIDIDPDCAQWAGDGVEVWIGSQDDRDFLRGVAEKAGPFDVVIDDGGHLMKQQISSFEVLFPAVRDGGIYVIEDLGTSYWPRFGGKLGKRNTCIEYLKGMVDVMNRCHLRHEWAKRGRIRSAPDELEASLSSVHFYNSMCFLYKRGHAGNPQSCDTLTF